MKIIDFKRKGNVVKFYLGQDDLKDWGGDDWNDKPYNCNAGEVYSEYVSGCAEVTFPFDYDVAEPSYSYATNCDWCKDDMKERKVPCIVAREEDEWHDQFADIVSDDNAIKFYFGDRLEPGKYIIGEGGKIKSLMEDRESQPTEEHKEYWWLDTSQSPMIRKSNGIISVNRKSCQSIGNYFETEKEAEEAVEKLRAWKKLKDHDLYIQWSNSPEFNMEDEEWRCVVEFRARGGCHADILFDLLFGENDKIGG